MKIKATITRTALDGEYTIKVGHEKPTTIKALGGEDLGSISALISNLQSFNLTDLSIPEALALVDANKAAINCTLPWLIENTLTLLYRAGVISVAKYDSYFLKLKNLEMSLSYMENNMEEKGIIFEDSPEFEAELNEAIFDQNK